jgi:hypothetical protein
MSLLCLLTLSHLFFRITAHDLYRSFICGRESLLFGRRFNYAIMLPLRGILKKEMQGADMSKKIGSFCYGSRPCLIHVCVNYE